MAEPTERNSGWTRVAFGEVVRKVADRVDPEESGLERYVAGEHMDTDDLRIRRWGTIGDGYLGPSFHMRFTPGQVLYGSRRTYLRKVAVADFEGITANTTYVLEPTDPNVLLPNLLPYIMQTESFHDHSIKQSKGSVNPYVNFSDLAWFEFDLPPPMEQRRIIELLTACRHAQESSDVALARATRLRRSVLLEYFPGGVGSETSTPLSELIDAGELDLQTGPFGTVLSAREYKEDGWPIINPTEMKGGAIDPDGAPCVDDETALRLERYRLRPGDVLLARKGDFSKAVIAQQDQEGWLAGSDTIRMRLTSESLDPRYLYLALQSPAAEQVLYSYSHGTVMPGLNEKVLGHLRIHLRDPKERCCVVQKIDELEAGMAHLRKRLVASRQAYAAAIQDALARGMRI